MIHSLQQFHAKGQELIARYSIDPESYTEFESTIKFSSGCKKLHKNGLECTLILRSGADYKAFGQSKSPSTALAEFEEDLAKLSGRVLDEFTFETSPTDDE
jgi:hypothetical protein